MQPKIWQSKTLILLIAGILAIFVGRTLLVKGYNAPLLSDILMGLIALGSLGVCVTGFRHLRPGDWLAAAALGALVGVEMRFATLFSPYPFFGVMRDNTGQAFVRGSLTFIATLGGLVIMRQGGPVQLAAANGDWRKSAHDALFGLAVGLPLAALNVVALQMTAGHGILWQNPFAALLDALQPGVVEEVIYRFGAWGLLWLMLRRSLPQQAASVAGLLALLVHNYAHLDALLAEAPLVALGMGLVMGIVWGLPPFFLARRRSLEAAMAFHWIQDAARFLVGF
ncbi:MAG TPA: hypothetical protein PKZ84_18300 [Anaerolineae bacterium]|nr:hypothetical protein [Anaerolineae bacterium]HQI85628.1 hypothetical protein [Anaerolineae bacterium]